MIGVFCVVNGSGFCVTGLETEMATGTKTDEGALIKIYLLWCSLTVFVFFFFFYFGGCLCGSLCGKLIFRWISVRLDLIVYFLIWVFWTPSNHAMYDGQTVYRSVNSTLEMLSFFCAEMRMIRSMKQPIAFEAHFRRLNCVREKRRSAGINLIHSRWCFCFTQNRQ